MAVVLPNVGDTGWGVTLNDAISDIDVDLGVVEGSIADINVTLGNKATTVQAVIATAAGTVAKATTTVEPAAGSFVLATFSNGNTASAITLAFNGGTARPILANGAAVNSASFTLSNGTVVLCYFDGTNLHSFSANISFSASNPAVDGTANPGASNNPARSDHVHPTDTTLVPKTITITGSGGISGGGALSANRTLTIADRALTWAKMPILTTGRALVSDGSGNVSVSAVTSAEVGYLSGATSSLQTQINTKQKNITVSTSNPSGGSDGDIWIKVVA